MRLRTLRRRERLRRRNDLMARSQCVIEGNSGAQADSIPLASFLKTDEDTVRLRDPYDQDYFM